MNLVIESPQLLLHPFEAREAERAIYTRDIPSVAEVTKEYLNTVLPSHNQKFGANSCEDFCSHQSRKDKIDFSSDSDDHGCARIIPVHLLECNKKRKVYNTGNSYIGKKVKVYWNLYRKYLSGQIMRVDKGRKHSYAVFYDDIDDIIWESLENINIVDIEDEGQYLVEEENGLSSPNDFGSPSFSLDSDTEELRHSKKESNQKKSEHEPGRPEDPVKWNMRFQELVDYMRKHGNCNVPAKQRPLGTWVMNQRARYKKGKLSQDRIDRLHSISFRF